MKSSMYDRRYFDRYLRRGKLTGKLHGDQWYLHRYWISYLRQHLPPSSTILEVGCGLGFFGKRVQRYFSYVGLDIAHDAITYAREINRIGVVVEGKAESLPFEDESFDALVAFDVIEHLNNAILFFREAYRALKPFGLMVVTTPNIRSFGSRIKSKSGSLIPAMYTDKTHVSLLSPETWIERIHSAGFTIIRHGTDTLWDIPYFKKIPLIVQKVTFVPVNVLATLVFGFFRWTYGENLVIIAKK